MTSHRITHRCWKGLGISAALFCLVLAERKTCAAFQPAVFASRRRGRVLYSSVGGGGGGDDDVPRPPSEGGWDDFLDPERKESENLRRARDFLSDASLPISFDEEEDGSASKADNFDEDGEEGMSSALVGPKAGSLLDGPSAEALANNPYIQVVSKLSPSELISKFTGSASPRVQDAVRSTILGLIGSLPKMAFDTTTITTGQRLASLMFQLQMTGYIFKSSDLRLSISQSLGLESEHTSFRNTPLLKGSEDEDDEKKMPLTGKIRGKLKLRYGRNYPDSEGVLDATAGNSSTVEMEVDAAAYMSELRTEVIQLQDELTKTRESKNDALRKDLLLYIRTLPEKELASLTDNMSPEVMVAMKGLVSAVMAGIGDGEIGPDTVTEQSGEAMAQLCMWQLVVGYNLRELEVREKMKKSLFSGHMDSGVDISDPDALE